MSQQSETFAIEGMTCGHCVKAVREALEETDGVEVVDVQIGRAEVRYDAATRSRAEVEEAIEEAGYTVTP